MDSTLAVISSLQLGCRKYHTRRERGVSKIKDVNRTLEEVAVRRAATKSKLKEKVQLSTYTKTTFILAFSCDGQLMASLHGDRTIRITDLALGRDISVLKGHDRSPWTAEFHRYHRNVLASGCLNGTVNVWDIQSEHCDKWPVGCDGAITSLSLHPTERIVIFSSGRCVYIWQWDKSDSGQILLRYGSTPCEIVRWVKFCPNGTEFYTGTTNYLPAESSWSALRAPPTRTQVAQLHAARTSDPPSTERSEEIIRSIVQRPFMDMTPIETIRPPQSYRVSTTEAATNTITNNAGIPRLVLRPRRVETANASTSTDDVPSQQESSRVLPSLDEPNSSSQQAHSIATSSTASGSSQRSDSRTFLSCIIDSMVNVGRHGRPISSTLGSRSMASHSEDNETTTNEESRITDPEGRPATNINLLPNVSGGLRASINPENDRGSNSNETISRNETTASNAESQPLTSSIFDFMDDLFSPRISANPSAAYSSTSSSNSTNMSGHSNSFPTISSRNTSEVIDPGNIADNSEFARNLGANFNRPLVDNIDEIVIPSMVSPSGRSNSPESLRRRIRALQNAGTTPAATQEEGELYDYIRNLAESTHQMQMYLRRYNRERDVRNRLNQQQGDGRGRMGVSWLRDLAPSNSSNGAENTNDSSSPAPPPLPPPPPLPLPLPPIEARDPVIDLVNTSGNRNPPSHPVRMPHIHHFPFRATQRIHSDIPAHRAVTIQRWTLSHDLPMDSLEKRDLNVIANQCRIHNDAGVDLSPCGTMIAVLSVKSDPTKLNIISTTHPDKPKILHSIPICNGPVSIAFSPCSKYIAVALVGKRRRPVPDYLTAMLMFDIFKIDSSFPCQSVRSVFTSQHTNKDGVINCIKWLPLPLLGLVIGTNQGDIILYHTTGGGSGISEPKTHGVGSEYYIPALASLLDGD